MLRSIKVSRSFLIKCANEKYNFSKLTHVSATIFFAAHISPFPIGRRTMYRTIPLASNLTMVVLSRLFCESTHSLQLPPKKFLTSHRVNISYPLGQPDFLLRGKHLFRTSRFPLLFCPTFSGEFLEKFLSI